MRSTEKKTFRIILYVLSGVLFVFAGFSLYESIKYIRELIAAGSLTVSGNQFNIISYCVEASAVYFIYGIVLFVLARFIIYIDESKSVKQMGADEFIGEINAEETKTLEVIETKELDNQEDTIEKTEVDGSIPFVEDVTNKEE